MVDRWAGAGVAGAGAAAGLIAYLGTDPELPEFGYLAVATGLVFCIVIAVAGVVVAVKRD